MGTIHWLSFLRCRKRCAATRVQIHMEKLGQVFCSLYPVLYSTVVPRAPHRPGHARVKRVFAQMKRAEHARHQGGANLKRDKAHDTMVRSQRVYCSSMRQWYFGPVHGRSRDAKVLSFHHEVNSMVYTSYRTSSKAPLSRGGRVFRRVHLQKFLFAKPSFTADLRKVSFWE